MAFAGLFKKTKPSYKPSDADVEEDGFVVVGETEDEKNTLTPNDPMNHQDVPPTYQNFESTSRPSTYNYPNQNNEAYTNIVPIHGQSRNTSSEIENVSTTQPNSTEKRQKSYIEDIPFHFSSSVEPALNYGKMNIDIGDLSTDLNSPNYEYDFKKEYEVLQSESH